MNPAAVTPEYPADGYPVALIGISVATAEVHRRNIKAKLGLHSAVDLTRYAIRKGLAAT